MTVRVTVSPTWTSPPTVPVIATVVSAASAALTMLSPVMASRRDARYRRHRVDRVSLVVGRRGGVARRVGRGDAGIHRQVRIRHQPAARHTSMLNVKPACTRPV